MSASSGGQAPPEFASTHPNPGTRIQNLQALMPKALEYRQRFCESARGHRAVTVRACRRVTALSLNAARGSTRACTAAGA